MTRHNRDRRAEATAAAAAEVAAVLAELDVAQRETLDEWGNKSVPPSPTRSGRLVRGVRVDGPPDARYV
jgi:hypothetical protein